MNILVTGGASGLGSAITRHLAATGRHRLFFTYHRSKDTAQQIEKEFPSSQGFSCDFTQPASLQSFLKQLAQLDLDVLVNNALAGMSVQHFHKMDPQIFLQRFQGNVLPMIQITQEAIGVFRKKKSGKIINILTSYIVNRPPVGLSEYVAAKAYLASLSKSWAVENAAFNISSNSISPSFMKTNLTRDTDERVLEEMEARAPNKKLLTPEEVAAAVEYLIAAGPQINGTNMLMNAGTDVI